MRVGFIGLGNMGAAKVYGKSAVGGPSLEDAGLKPPAAR